MGSADAPHDLPYWQVNIPPDQRAAACPDFLRNLSAKDQRIIGTPQADYAVMSWPEVRAIVAANRLDRFQRDPLALRRYLAYCWGLRKEYGSAVNFVLRERLRWTEAELQAAAAAHAEAVRAGGAGTPDFSGPGDALKILCNDWPYGIDERIVHLVVWTKFPLADDPATGDLTDDARAAIEAYVQETFGQVGEGNYIWFKNWKSLKSVLLVEHFHVMLFDPPAAFVARITGNDVPLSRRLETQS